MLAQRPGYIQRRAYKEGSFVRQGELLYLIDPRNYKELSEQARHTLDRNIAALENARINFERDKKLVAADAITRQQYDNDDAALRGAAESVETSRAALKQAQLLPQLDPGRFADPRHRRHHPGPGKGPALLSAGER